MARRALWLLFGSLLACHEPAAAGPLEASHGAGNAPSANESPAPTSDATTPVSDASTGTPTAPTPSIEKGDLAVTWQAGSANCAQNQDPPLQVHAYNDNLVLLRENKCTNFEAPFLYLFFGASKALLLDSGATASATTFPVRERVEALLEQHYGAGKRASISLVVAHTHGHGDHRSGDGQFAGQPGTVVVGTTPAAVAAFFGIKSWPDDTAEYD
jgi:hydroxyacylglutathione hydrolase